MSAPDGIRYTQDHVWCRLEWGHAVLGITEHGQYQLGPISHVELASVGDVVQKGTSLGTIESAKAVSEILSPLTGRVTAVNDLLSHACEVLNADPCGNGWMLQLEWTDAAEFGALMDEIDYRALLDGGAGPQKRQR
ncbi:MAG TPA: glycine cleavage system H protein [Anaeromyxobacteraceae bacterium]|nr:glycine cleavage system H protein [Anaeromyxobacteraceae bacterium]